MAADLLTAVHRSPSTLSRLGLRLGEPIRFRRNDKGRWIIGRVSGVAADGSVTLRDPDGSARSLRAERLEIAERRGSIAVDAKMGECEGTE